MEDSFLSLRQEVKSSKDLRTCIETLVTIFRNVAHNPEENKFRTLRTGNKNFNESLWKFDAGQQIMLDCGWILKGDNIVLPLEADLTLPIIFLLENRDVKPSAKEWVSETKHIIPNADKEKERQLRQEALAKKEKEMIELKREMAEREDIKRRIIAEHRYDQEKRKVPVGGSSRDLDQSAPTANSTVSTPQRFSSSNVLGGSPLPNAGAASFAHTTAHRLSSTFPPTSTHNTQHLHQQTAESGHYTPSFGASRHTTGAGSGHYTSPYGTGRRTAAGASQRFQHQNNGVVADEAPLRLGTGAAAGRGYSGYEDFDDHDY